MRQAQRVVIFVLIIVFNSSSGYRPNGIWTNWEPGPKLPQSPNNYPIYYPSQWTNADYSGTEDLQRRRNTLPRYTEYGIPPPVEPNRRSDSVHSNFYSRSEHQQGYNNYYRDNFKQQEYENPNSRRDYGFPQFLTSTESYQRYSQEQGKNSPGRRRRPGLNRKQKNKRSRRKQKQGSQQAMDGNRNTERVDFKINGNSRNRQIQPKYNRNPGANYPAQFHRKDSDDRYNGYNYQDNGYGVYYTTEGTIPPTTTTTEVATTTLEPYDINDIKVPTEFLRIEYMISFSFLGLMYGLGFLVFFQSLCVTTAKITVWIVYFVLVRSGTIEPYTIQDVLQQIPPQ